MQTQPVDAPIRMFKMQRNRKDKELISNKNYKSRTADSCEYAY